MEFRQECGRCRTALREDDPAYICAHDCTYCATCYRTLRYVCPRCSGELVRRPRPGPRRAPATPTADPGRGEVRIREAGVADADQVAPLFDAYRQFYEQPADLTAAKQFLSRVLSRKESRVLVAERAHQAVGFVQLYPLYSSISLGPIYVLNDLFVEPSSRRHRVGASLLRASRELGESAGAHYLELSTAVDNPAQRLYEGMGWSLDREFLHYELTLRPEGIA